jgi:hypothetical protein
MDKNNLLALCATLGIVADASMTIAQLNELLSAYKPATTVADATSTIIAPTLPKGISPLSTFRYYEGKCFISLKNGISCMVGTSTEFPFPTMLSLKGMGVSMKYEPTGKTWTDSKMVVHPKYKVDWSVE